jgi:CheY-like chemotaxis protein
VGRVKKVLVVDDEADIVAVLAAVLADHDVTVLPAYDGREALEIARRERPDLVLSDLMMPGLDGRELCRRIKADPDLSGTRVALMSAVYKLDLRECGEDAFVPKPFGLDRLAGTIRRLLAGEG